MQHVHQNPHQILSATDIQAHNEEVALLEKQIAQLDEKIAQLKKILPHLKKENWQHSFEDQVLKKRA